MHMSHGNEDVNVLLLKQLVPFTLNISHYMTDLAYTLYYSVMLHHDDDSKESKQLQQSKIELCDEIYSLRDGFRRMLNRSSGSIYGKLSGRSENEDDGDNYTDESKTVVSGDSSSTSGEDNEEVYRLILMFKELFDSKLLRVIKVMNELLERDLALQSSDIDKGKLLIQLKNCMLGFYNLIHFIRRIPVKSHTESSPQQYHDDNRDSMESIIAVLRDELLATWKTELDLLNCKIFGLISKNSEILDRFHEYQRKNGIAVEETGKEDGQKGISEDSQTFIELISWLKDDQVFTKTAL